MQSYNKHKINTVREAIVWQSRTVIFY